LPAAAKQSASTTSIAWLGGTLHQLERPSRFDLALRKLEEMLGTGAAQSYTKKERLTMQRERDKLDRSSAASRTWAACPT